MTEPKAKRIVARFWATKTGNEPVRDLLKGLSKADKLRVGEDLKTVEFGWPIGMPTCRAMGDGLQEVRTPLTNNRELRVLFFVRGQEAMLLHAFFKKTQQTPRQELELARTRMRECQLR